VGVPGPAAKFRGRTFDANHIIGRTLSSVGPVVTPYHSALLLIGMIGLAGRIAQEGAVNPPAAGAVVSAH
jgi:hypothetical protein